MAEKQIEIKNLSKVYDNGFKALSNINLEINKGEIFAMLGPNGAGKTSLISIILTKYLKILITYDIIS